MIVSVADTGSGIDDEDKRHLFEKWNSFGRQGGSGLGLLIADKIVRLWCKGLSPNSEPVLPVAIDGLALGQIHVQSPVSSGYSPGMPGSRFSFVLPVMAAADEAKRPCEQQAEEQRADALALPGRGLPNARPLKRILVVEDDPVNAMLMMAMLRTDPAMSDLQLDVQTVPTAERALQMLAATEALPFDLLIFDEHLESGGGLMLGSDAIKHLRQRDVDSVMVR